MKNATTNENMNEVAFLTIVAFFPKYLISMGIVTMPTIISVDMKAAICMYPAPFCNRAAANGKAINAGTNVIDPIIAAINTPYHPDSLPNNFEICSGVNMANNIPIIIKIDRNWGKIFSNDFHAFLRARIVIALLLKNEMESAATVII